MDQWHFFIANDTIAIAIIVIAIVVIAYKLIAMKKYCGGSYCNKHYCIIAKMEYCKNLLQYTGNQYNYS